MNIIYTYLTILHGKCNLEKRTWESWLFSLSGVLEKNNDHTKIINSFFFYFGSNTRIISQTTTIYQPFKSLPKGMKMHVLYKKL